MKNYWLSVDPSINNIGYCIWADTDLIGYGFVKSKAKNNGVSGLIEKAESINSQLDEDLKDMRLFRVVIEFPGSFTRDNKNVESIEKLLFSIGLLANFFMIKKKCVVEFVKVSDWKGNNSKKLTERYIRQYLNLSNSEKISDHECDACGIGMYYLKKNFILK